MNTTRRYCEYLKEMSSPHIPFSIQAAAFYYIEVVYNKAWATVLKYQDPHGKYFQYASRWYIRLVHVHY